MRKPIITLADRLMSAVLPRDEAAAGCPPDCQVNYVCQNHYEYTQTCCYSSDCTVKCGPLMFYGRC